MGRLLVPELSQLPIWPELRTTNPLEQMLAWRHQTVVHQTLAGTKEPAKTWERTVDSFAAVLTDGWGQHVKVKLVPLLCLHQRPAAHRQRLPKILPTPPMRQSDQ